MLHKLGLCEYVIVHTILGGSPVILWISLGGKPKWLPLKFGYHDVMRTSPIDFKASFRMPKFALISTLLVFEFQSPMHVCWEKQVIFSDNKSTKLLPKPFWVVEMHLTAKIIWQFVLRPGTFNLKKMAPNDEEQDLVLLETRWTNGPIRGILV